MTKLHHWKQLSNPDYLGAYDFEPNEERIVTVKQIIVEKVKSERGEEECTVCHFVEPFKPMILNVTNCKAISKLFDTPYIEQWVGKSFKIVVAKVKAFGDVVDALRIKSEKVVKAKPVLQFGTPNFDACKKAYQADKTQLEKIKAKYDVSNEVEAQLNA